MYSKTISHRARKSSTCSCINDIITLTIDLKISPPGRPIASGIGTLTETFQVLSIPFYNA